VVQLGVPSFPALACGRQDGGGGLMAARPVSPRRALEEQLRTVSAQLSESLASLGVMDGQEYLTTAPLEPALVPDGQAPVPDSTAALLDRIRELEVQTQTLQQRQQLAGPAPGAGFAAARPSPPRSPRWSNAPAPEAESRPVWGSPLGVPSPRREQYAAARSRSNGSKSPRRRPGRSPSAGRSTTPNGKPPPQSKQRREPQAETRRPRKDAATSAAPEFAESLSGWGSTSETEEMQPQVDREDQAGAAAVLERGLQPPHTQTDAPAQPELSPQTLEQLQQKLAEMEVADAVAASHRSVLEQRLADSEKELSRVKASRSKSSGSPGRRGRSPRRSPARSRSPKHGSTASSSPEEQSRLGSTGRAETSPGRSSVVSAGSGGMTSPRGSGPTRVGGGYGGDVILSRGSREEKEKLLAQVAALQAAVADAENRKLLASQTLQSLCTCAAALRNLLTMT
jgi:hypothetical protein